MMSRLYALNKFPGNEIIFYVRDQNGSPIVNASIYVYYTNENAPDDKYPEAKIKTNAYGIVSLSSTNNLEIAANVFAIGYMQGLTEQKFYRTNFINTVELKSYNAIKYAVPISGFNNMNEWTTTRTYLDSCQNYGWRYGMDSQSEFHQGIDIARPKGTTVYSSTSGEVVKSDYYGSCGLLVQIEKCYYKDPIDENNNKYYYFIYQHLNNKTVMLDDSVTQGQYIGTVGNTGGNYGYHLHFSVSNTASHYLTSRDYMDPLALILNQSSYYDYNYDGSERW